MGPRHFFYPESENLMETITVLGLAFNVRLFMECVDLFGSVESPEQDAP